MRIRGALLVALVATGCAGTPPNVAPDASIPHDAFVPSDAFGSTDAALSPDAFASDAGAAALTGTIVPLYTDPSNATWQTIRAAAMAHPSVRVVAVINPNSGPTASVDPAYTSGIAMLQAAHVVVVGYVATGYGNRLETDVSTDIDAYATQYPTLDGIFFDEAAIYETGHEARYGAESSHARTAGFDFLIANPGTAPDPAYDDLFDVAMVFESDGAPAATTLAAFAPRRTHCAIIPYAVASLDTAYVQSIRDDVAYVYLTDDDLPNPWDTLPSYFDALLAALE